MRGLGCRNRAVCELKPLHRVVVGPADAATVTAPSSSKGLEYGERPDKRFKYSRPDRILRDAREACRFGAAGTVGVSASSTEVGEVPPGPSSTDTGVDMPEVSNVGARLKSPSVYSERAGLLGRGIVCGLRGTASGVWGGLSSRSSRAIASASASQQCCTERVCCTRAASSSNLVKPGLEWLRAAKACWCRC